MLGSTWETVPEQGDSLITKTFTSDNLEECSVERTALAHAMIQALGKHTCLGCIGVGVKEMKENSASKELAGFGEIVLKQLQTDNEKWRTMSKLLKTKCKGLYPVQWKIRKNLKTKLGTNN